MKQTTDFKSGQICKREVLEVANFLYEQGYFKGPLCCCFSKESFWIEILRNWFIFPFEKRKKRTANTPTIIFNVLTYSRFGECWNFILFFVKPEWNLWFTFLLFCHVFCSIDLFTERLLSALFTSVAFDFYFLFLRVFEKLLSFAKMKKSILCLTPVS